jgi:hypothetical protein
MSVASSTSRLSVQWWRLFVAQPDGGRFLTSAFETESCIAGIVEIAFFRKSIYFSTLAAVLASSTDVSILALPDRLSNCGEKMPPIDPLKRRTSK